MYIKNLKSPRSGRAVANQFVLEKSERYYFQSYDSLIAVVFFDKEERCYRVALGPDWDYSVTTMKYLCQFLHEYYDSSSYWYKTDIKRLIKECVFVLCDFESELEKF